MAAAAAVAFVISNSIVMWVAASFIKLIIVPDFKADPTPTTDWHGINEYLKALSWQWIGGGDSFDKLFRVSIFISIGYTIAGASKFLQERTLALLEQRLASRLRSGLFEHYLRQGLGFFHKRKAGELMTLIISDAQTLNQNLTKVFGIFLRDPAIVIVSIVLLAAISWKLLLLTLLVGPLAGFIIDAVGRSLKRKSVRLQRAMEDLSILLTERLNGILLIKTSGTRELEGKKFGSTNHMLFDRSFKQRQLDVLGLPVTEVFGMYIIVTILLVGGYSVTHSAEIDSEDFLRFILILFSMLQPARSIANGWASLNIVTASATRIFTMLDTNEALPETERPVELPKVVQPIRFEQVHFGYEGTPTTVLNGIDLTIRENETLAVVGLSGAGKSTLFSLMLRMYDPTSGAVRLGNTDIRNFHADDYRRQFGVVTQETILFHDTVAANIAYGYPEATHDEIVAAARLAYADSFIREFPNGYDTIIGDRGVRLSGGQRQRLSLARAFVRKPLYILLDEATSNLDSDSETLIQRALDNMRNLQTLVIIAHRIATIRNADRIALVDGGVIVEAGTYAELMERSELFARLSHQQFLA